MKRTANTAKFDKLDKPTEAVSWAPGTALASCGSGKSGRPFVRYLAHVPEAESWRKWRQTWSLLR